MPFTAVTNYVQFGVEMNREIMKYFAEYNTPHRSMSYNHEHWLWQYQNGL
jgi:hypothetical protein